DPISPPTRLYEDAPLEYTIHLIDTRKCQNRMFAFVPRYKETTMNKTCRIWASLVLLTLVTLVLSSCATSTTKVYHVGILSGLDFFANTADSFKTKMAELSYVEGKNIIYDLQKTNVDPTTEAKILDKFVADQVDLIFVFPTEVSLAAKQATQGTNI